jgi:hypothetical protein
MSNRKKKRRRKTQATMPPKTRTAIPAGAPVWKRIPGLIWWVVGLVSVLAGLYPLYPALSVNQDFVIEAPNPFGVQNPYDASFSVGNDGYLTARDLSVSCEAHITLVSPDPQSSMLTLPLNTTKNYEHFSARLAYKRRTSLPCIGNIIANGHWLTPDSTLTMVVSYRVWPLPGRRSQTFEFQTLVDAGGKPYWQPKG